MKNIKTEGIAKRSQNYSQWYLDVVEAAQMAENSPVRGCMIIKPYGYALWENMQKILDLMLKAHNVENAYFPLFIPESFLKREASHVKGFSPELAVVTHAGGKKLEEPLVVRPTSETIMYETYSDWIKSYRDLPLLINQWANVVRWELRPRLFLRTTEFLWQEGHTAHATPEDAISFSLTILEEVYKVFAQDYMAMPVYTGRKSDSERFAGAVNTFCIEALMQDGKSLQAGTSHYLGDNFAKVFEVQYQDEDGKLRYVHQTSWGVSTRLIGGLIMSHSDDIGLVLPPKIAPVQVVIVPVFTNEGDAYDLTLKKAYELEKELAPYVKVKVDNRTNLRLGEKFFEWERKGVPLRVEIGKKEIESNRYVLARRDTGEKTTCECKDALSAVKGLLDNIQKNLFDTAFKRRKQTNHKVDKWTDFEKAIEEGGYVFAHWCGSEDCEAQIKEKTKATTRCQRFDEKAESGVKKCVHCGKQSPDNKRWIFAKAY